MAEKIIWTAQAEKTHDAVIDALHLFASGSHYSLQLFAAKMASRVFKTTLLPLS
jgi:hypothetical protein